jgi:hypothetical protein
LLEKRPKSPRCRAIEGHRSKSRRLPPQPRKSVRLGVADRGVGAASAFAGAIDIPDADAMGQQAPRAFGIRQLGQRLADPAVP